MKNQLTECEYCGGVRVYDPAHSCPGCGATLKKPPQPVKNPFRPMSNAQEQYQQMLGQQNQINQYQMGMYGGPPYRGGKGGW